MRFLKERFLKRCGSVVIIISIVINVGVCGIGVMHHQSVHSNLGEGHSFGTNPEHWNQGDPLVMTWKAWARENTRLEQQGAFHGTNLHTGPTKELRWPELPSKVQCGHGICKASRKGHIKASITGSGMVICRDCPNPHTQGSLVDFWPSHWTYPDYHIDAEIVYTIPNVGAKPILNVEHVHDNIALVDRGQVAIAELARTLQDAGALALIVADDNRCDASFNCGRLGVRRPGEGFAAKDQWHRWVGIVMPVFLVTQNEGQRLKSMMPLTSIDIPGMGLQWVCEEDLR